jgi:hypothetical protein
MASVTSNSSTADPLANRLPGALTLRIEPLRTWFELHLQELRSYRELLFFLVWRDCQIPHTVHYSVLDAGLTRLLFQFHGSRTLPLALRSDPMAGVIDGTRCAPHRHGPSAGLQPLCVCRNRHPLGFRRAFVFQSQGRQHRGQSVETQMKAWLSQSKDQSHSFV